MHLTVIHSQWRPSVNQSNPNQKPKRRIENGERGIGSGTEIRSEIETGIGIVGGATETGTRTRIVTGTGGETGTGIGTVITSETETGIGIEIGIRKLTSCKIMGLQSNLRKAVWTCTSTWSRSLQKDTCCLKMVTKWSRPQRVTEKASSNF